jgi:hypothetical protein
MPPLTMWLAAPERKPMAGNMQIEIPQAMRDLAVKNIGVARAAYAQLMDSARKAQEMMIAAIPSNPVVQGLNEVQERAMRFTRQNVDAGFSLADELTKAANLAEMLQIQSRHAQLQMHAFVLQAQEFAGMAKRRSTEGELNS